MIQRAAFFCTTLFLPSQAFAHVGHVGELAGHAHWVGVAAIAGAAAIAGLVAIAGRKRKAASGDDEPSRDSPEATAGDAEEAAQ